MESVIFVKKYELCENSFSDENFSSGPIDEPLPEIEARFSGKEVLIRVHCERKKGVLEKIVSEIEKLNLSVVNSSAMAFGDSAMDVTIIAQVFSFSMHFLWNFARQHLYYLVMSSIVCQSCIRGT